MMSLVRIMSAWNDKRTELAILVMARSVKDLLCPNSRYLLKAMSTYVPEWTFNLCPCYCDFYHLHN
jgi:hypothetical protein